MPLIEVHHDLLKDVLIHLPVCRGNARLGHETQQMLAHTVDALHAVVDKVDLSSGAPVRVRSRRASLHSLLSTT